MIKKERILFFCWLFLDNLHRLGIMVFGLGAKILNVELVHLATLRYNTNVKCKL